MKRLLLLPCVGVYYGVVSAFCGICFFSQPFKYALINLPVIILTGLLVIPKE